jgi:hypothetical protein
MGFTFLFFAFFFFKRQKCIVPTFVYGANFVVVVFWGIFAKHIIKKISKVMMAG